MRSTPGRIERACQELLGTSAEIGVPRLMEQFEFKSPGRVAARLDVGLNAVREWLLNRGWFFDGENKKWVAPMPESQPDV